MSLIKRISIVDKAVLTATGNSSCVCGSSTEVLINTSDMVMPDGTLTRDYSKAGSSAVLDILSNSTILYAELLWYSTVVATFPGSVDVRSIQDNPITVTMPNGDIKYITPDNGQDFTTFATNETVRFRSANVTSLIQSYLGGTYTVSNIPTSIPPTGLNNSRCAWSLNVIYRNDALPPKKIDFLSGVEYSTSTIPYQTTISGFTTSDNSSYLEGQMLLTVANGLPLSGNENVSIGPSLANLTVLGNPVGAPNSNPLTAPNNPYNNFFTGQINNCNTLSSNMGIIDIRGTNGTNNNDGFIPRQVVGARNKWDMTGIDISNTLVPNQTQLAFQLISGQYSVQIMSIGTQIATIAPDITVNLDVYDTDGDNEYNVPVGKSTAYAITVKNNGLLDANNVTLSLNPGSYASIVPNSLTINNVAASGNITRDINIGTVGAHGVSVVKFEVMVNSLPPLDVTSGYHTITNGANYSYQFVSGINTITNTGISNSKTLIVESESLTCVKSSSSLTPTVGETIVYTNVITNTGTAVLSNMVFQDLDTPYTSFVPNSVYIDDVLKTGLDPAVGFSLDDVLPGNSVTINYSVTIDTPSKSGNVNTASIIKYSYLFNQYDNPIYVTTYSNTISLALKYSQIMKTICPSTSYPKVGDTVNYTTDLTNTGNISVTNVLVKDAPVTGASFIDGTVTVNGASVTGVNPYTGFTLSTPIAPGTTTEVNYDVKINSLPSKEVINNTAEIPFQYIITNEQGTISNTNLSNTVETLSNYVCLAMIESVSKSCATLNDEIYYTVNITNNGNIGATNTLFTSTIQSDTAFVPGSVTINGISYPSYNPIIGFSIGSICIGNTVQVVFKVKVNNIPSSNILYNQCNLSYSYLPNPTGTSVNESITSNRVETSLNQTSYTVTLSVDKAYAVVGDYLVYTTLLNNTGSTELSNIKFYDNLPNSVQFITGSVYINGINGSGYDPNVGFSIDTLHPGDTARVIFGVQVVSVPLAGYVLNNGIFNLTYQTCSDLPIVTTSAYSNEVKTYIVNGNLSINKETNKSYAKLNDIITYSFNLSNTGNVPLNNVLFSDNLSSSLQVVPGSVIVNNVSKPTYDPVAGFSLNTLNVGQAVKISFNVTVINVPIPNIISNYGTGSYTYIIDPANQPTTQSKNSNTVTTTVNKSDSTLTKQVDKPYAIVNDILTYTLVITNTGTVPLTNVEISDALQNEAQFVTGSVVINGVSQPSYNPGNGFIIDNILAGGSATIIFKAKVTEVPTSYKILNTGNMSYQYTLIPSTEPSLATRTSNTVTTTINTVSVTNTKTVDKAYTTSNDTLTYTSTITNNSTVPLTNTTFIDVIPLGTTFVEGSVTIDGATQGSYNPQIGFTLGTITPNQSIIVQFKVRVVEFLTVEAITNQSNINYSYQLYGEQSSIMSGNTLSNTVTSVLKVGSVNVTKTADRTYAKLNDIVTYSVNILNTGNTILQNVLFKDIIQSDSTLIADSVYINDVKQTGFDVNTDINLPDIGIGGSLKIVFSVQVNRIPASGGELKNTGTVTYSYYVDPTQLPYTGTKDSNTTTVTVLDTIMSITKEVDKTFAKIGDIVNYTICVDNTGVVTATNVNFLDILDDNLEFIAGSVYIEGESYNNYNPNTGFPLPNIIGGNCIDITFAARIVSRPILSNTVYNSATTTYSYTIGGTTYNGTMTSNTVNTVVGYGELTITKSLDRIYGSINDVINYTVVIQNTGSVNATSMSFKDTIENDALFNINSVVVDGVNYPNYNPNNGFALSDLLPGKSHVISFSTKIVSVPSSGKIDNIASTTFTYQLTSSDTPVTTTTNSNIVTTYVNLGNLTVTKDVDKAYATINDIITYTFNITNTGNVVCTNALFKDIVQSDATFVAQSVTINDNLQIAYNPNTGFSLPDINPKATVKVVFKVQVNTVPSNQTLYNSATVGYSYYVSPNSSLVSASASSNTVETVINLGQLSVTKVVDKAYATVGDTLTYTVNITNTGNINALAINFRDVISTGLTFVTGSVTIGGTSYTDYNPYDSFTLGTLASGQSVQVTFKTLVTSVPTPNTALNTANIVFSYYIDPTGAIKTVQTDSNTVQTIINIASMTIAKTVDKAYATSNEVLTYSFVLTNTGNIDLTNVTFIDNLQTDVVFNAGSVIVNGTSMAGFDPTVGFSLGTVATLDVVNISFTVTVISSPIKTSVIDFGYATYSYKINPSGETYSSTTQSNTVYTTLVLPSIIGTKAVDLAFATIGDTLNYTVIIKNTGNYLLSSITFIDTLSSGGTFIPGSVYIDDVNYSSYSPITGFNLPNLIAGNTAKVQFKATVANLPSPPVITNYAVSTAKCIITETGATLNVSTMTNTVLTNIVVGSLSSTKTVDKMYTRVGDTVTYTSVITNNGNITATNLLFKDILQKELTFVTGTVKIGNVEYPLLNPVTGFSLSDLAQGNSVTVSFNAVVNALPVPPIVYNSSTTTFNYKVDPSGTTYNGSSTSNTVSTNVVVGKLTAVKSVDKALATVGDDLTYTVILTNTGNVAINTINFEDTPSTDAIFKAGSVTINGTSYSTYDPTKGFIVPDIAIGEVATIEFKATVVSVPTSNNVTNTATASFSYVVDPKQQPYTATTTSNTVTTNIALSKLDVTKVVDKTYATIGDKLTYTITIKNVGNVNATEVKFIDKTPANTIFVTSSVTVNGQNYLSYNPEIGFNLNTIVPGQTVTVVYQVQVINLC